MAAKKDEKSVKLGGPLDFLRFVWAIEHELQSASKTMARRTGVTERQRLVLKILGKNASASASDIAGILHLHPSTMTGIVQRLTARGYIARSKHAEDARKGKLELTAKGKAVNDQKGSQAYETAVKKALGKFDDTKLDVARDVLAAIADELGAKPAAEGKPAAKKAPAKKAAKPAARKAPAKAAAKAPAKKAAPKAAAKPAAKAAAKPAAKAAAKPAAKAPAKPAAKAPAKPAAKAPAKGKAKK